MNVGLRTLFYLNIRLKFSISQSVRKDEEGRKPIKAIVDEIRHKELNFCHKVRFSSACIS